MSTHSVDVIKIKNIRPHPNADRLEIVDIYEFTCCVKKGEWKVGDLAAYIEPDYVVNVDLPEFNFLKKKPNHHKERIKPKRLRGIMSQGLLVPAPKGLVEGDNAIKVLDVERYKPIMKTQKGFVKVSNTVKGPEGWYPKYDLENWRRYSDLFMDNEEVFITEKLHGANARFRFADGEMYCGSRSRWVANDGKNSWSLALEQNPWIVAFCENHPDLTVYGEIYGWVQDLRYGHEQGKISFCAFDLLKGNRWLNWSEIVPFWRPINHRELEDFHEGEHLVWVPFLSKGCYNKATITRLVDGPTEIPGADHVREGIVVKPVQERYDERLGRVALKCVSNEYLTRAK